MSTAYKAFKYRIYPNKEQAELIDKTFGCCRKMYNLLLEDAIKSYESTGKFVINYTSSYKNEYPYFKEVDSIALNYARQNLEKAFKNRFGKTRKTNIGFPKFKSIKHSRKSYTTYNGRGTAIKIKDNKIKLPKLKYVKIKIDDRINDTYKIKNATLSKNPDDKYYISILCEYEKSDDRYVANTSKSLGLDYSSSNLFIDSNGNKGSYHKYYKESQDKLAKMQRKLSRKKGNLKGEEKSNNYLKQLKKINKLYIHISNQRLDTLHKLSTEIANQYDIVCVEDLNMRDLSNKGFGNGKSTMDNGYGMFLNMLEYKMNDRNKYFIKVNKYFPSSQLCHCCGYKNTKVKNLSIRKWECPICHTHNDRDINAAINIKNEGLKILSEMIA